MAHRAQAEDARREHCRRPRSTSRASGLRSYMKSCVSVVGCPIQPQLKVDLAPWQQRLATAYIQKSLNERIPIGTLAQLVRLNPHHFCRICKQSLRMPPHRYQTNRRIEHAKVLLANRAGSMTEIGLVVGLSSRNAFATLFRKATGISPTDYRRSATSPTHINDLRRRDQLCHSESGGISASHCDEDDRALVPARKANSRT